MRGVTGGGLALDHTVGDPGRSHDVVLADESDPIVGDVVVTASSLEGTVTVGGLIGLGRRVDVRWIRRVHVAHVQGSGTLTGEGRTLHIGSVGHQHLLDLVGGQLRMLVEHQCHTTGHHRRCLTATGTQEVGAVHGRLGIVEIGIRTGGPQAEDRTTRRHQVHEPLRRSTVRERRHTRNLGCVVLRRSHRDHERVIGRVPQRSRVAVVPGRRHHHDAGIPRLLHHVRQRIPIIRLHTVGAVRQSDHPNVHPVVVAMLYHPVDRRDHLGHVHRTLRIRNLDVHQPGTRRHTLEVRIGVVTTGDDPRQMGAMTKRIQIPQIRSLRLERQIRTIDHLARPRQTIHRHHTRIDQGDIDT